MSDPVVPPAPCPFCGSAPYVTCTVNGTRLFKVGCASCGVELKAAWYRGEDHPTKDILALWNTRAAAPVVPVERPPQVTPMNCPDCKACSGGERDWMEYCEKHQPRSAVEQLPQATGLAMRIVQALVGNDDEEGPMMFRKMRSPERAEQIICEQLAIAALQEAAVVRPHPDLRAKFEALPRYEVASEVGATMLESNGEIKLVAGIVLAEQDVAELVDDYLSAASSGLGPATLFDIDKLSEDTGDVCFTPKQMDALFAERKSAADRVSALTSKIAQLPRIEATHPSGAKFQFVSADALDAALLDPAERPQP